MDAVRHLDTPLELRFHRRARHAAGWRRDGDTIEFDWVESGLAEIPNIECESFGTQFIRTLIERQLKGKWTRTVADRALHITLRWPDRVADA